MDDYRLSVYIYIYISGICHSICFFLCCEINAATTHHVQTKIKFYSGRCSQHKRSSVSTVSALVKDAVRCYKRCSKASTVQELGVVKTNQAT